MHIYTYTVNQNLGDTLFVTLLLKSVKVSGILSLCLDIKKAAVYSGEKVPNVTPVAHSYKLLCGNKNVIMRQK